MIRTAGSLLRAFGATHVGRRRAANEDRFHVDSARGIFVVVDGVGGQAAGDKAADIAIAVITERLERETGKTTDRVREAIAIANNEIFRQATSRPEWRGMACVATAAVIDGDRAVVGHVGDSRLYRLTGAAIEKITPDHSPVGEREDAREMSELEAMRHPRRNEVYRDIGSEPRDVSDENFVFATTIDVPPGAALLLCSDGLTDLVPSDTIRALASEHAGSPKTLVHALIDAANDAGGKDNITAVYVERPIVGATRGHLSARAALFVSLACLAALLAGAWLGSLVARPPGTVVVGPGGSIMAATTRALPGSVVIVEPGEYRERVTLRDGVRLISRVPRGATIRLPVDAADSDAAVVAAGIAGAELRGFRIVGDAATPLGVGVSTRDATVHLSDLEITGATTAALDLGSGGDVSVSGAVVHDNPGSAMVIRSGASPRITNTVLSLNAWSDLMSAPVVVEAGATPEWSQNVFNGMGPDTVIGLDAVARATLSRDNWFIASPTATSPAVRRREPAQ